MRWQLTIMTIKLPGAPPARTPINARYETRPAARRNPAQGPARLAASPDGRWNSWSLARG
jgi:hypothetical protein